MALDLVKGFSAKSWVSKRLWKTIKGLKEVGPKLGLVNGSEDPHSTAALAMAGLAGHEISGLGGAYEGPVTGMGASSPNGFRMSHDMTSLFEAALGTYNGVSLQDGTVGSNVFGGDEELYRQMRDLF